jgi:hypothetical protein
MGADHRPAQRGRADDVDWVRTNNYVGGTRARLSTRPDVGDSAAGDSSAEKRKGGLRDTDSVPFPPLGRGLPIGSRKPHRPQTYLQRLGLARTKTSDPAHIDL